MMKEFRLRNSFIYGAFIVFNTYAHGFFYHDQRTCALLPFQSYRKASMDSFLINKLRNDDAIHI